MNRLIITDIWVIKERIGGKWVEVLRTHNLLTTYGLSAYAIAPGGTWTPPIYLVVDTDKASLVDGYPATSTILQTDVNPTIGGDTSITIGAGLNNQEDVAFNSITGSGPFTFTLSGSLQFDHSIDEPAVRTPTVNDTVSSIQSEAQYDPLFAPNQRNQVTAAYSADVGYGVIQFFFSAEQASGLYFAHVGMADTAQIGTGNLHNYAVLGYTRNTTNDLEVDVNYRLTNV